MKRPRRRFLQLAGAVAAATALPQRGWALDYPTRPVRLIVGLGAGGTPDIIARLLGQYLSERLGQQLIVENRPGAGTNIATEAVVKAAPDGYTLLLVAIPPTNTSPILYHNVDFDFVRDIAPVASLARTPQIMLVHPTFPATTVPELIAYAKANPGKINMASTGTGNLSHLSGELFKMMTGIDMLHVPYRGAPAAEADLLSGRVQLMFDTIPAAIVYVRAGKLRALAVSTETRLEALPDVPTVGETVPGFEISGAVGIGAPKDTPVEIVDKLNKEINAVLAEPQLTARFSDLGATVQAGSPADFGSFIAVGTEKWAKVIAFANIKAE